MRVGFFLESAGFDMAKYLIASVNKVMPGVPVVQLTNGDAKVVDGAQVLRIPGPMPMGVRRITHYTQLEGDWCLVDSDVVFREDVRHVFDKPFDVALASREGTIWAGSEYAKVFPYNFGVVFSRNPKFWQTALRGLKSLPPKMQEWEGEQFVTGQLALRKDFDVHILPCAYNYTPATKDEDLSNVKVLHLKGPRKAWACDLA